MEELRTQAAPGFQGSARESRIVRSQSLRVNYLWVIISALLLTISIILGIFIYNNKFSGQATENAKEPQLYNIGPVHSFEPFVVNIAGANATRYLRVGINVECSSKKAHAKIIENELRLRDRILDLLCVQSINDLLDISRRDKLRIEMARKIREALGDEGDNANWVTSIYFSEFTIQ